MRRARTPHELGFDRYDRRRLAHALQRATDLRLFRRLQAVLLVARGWAVSAVALLTGAKANAIYWVRLYLEMHRTESLGDAPRSGRPRTAPRITDARII